MTTKGIDYCRESRRTDLETRKMQRDTQKAKWISSGNREEGKLEALVWIEFSKHSSTRL